MTEKHTPSERELTDLEGVVIAFVFRRQPCTPYAIRQSFQKSPTRQFSKSAGSIYPLVRRLANRGFLIPDDSKSDGRGTCLYRVTSIGLRKAQAWLTNLDDPSEIGIYDPIRSRLANLNLLSGKKQIYWLRLMIKLLKQQEDLISLYETQEFLGDDRLHSIVREGLWAENAFRLRWLRNALNTLEKEEHEK